MNDNIKSKLTLLPDKPGVYLMKNSAEKVIYVGKAKVLKNRVRSYFSGKPSDRKTAELVQNIHDFDYIITGTEQQALILENDLIKKYWPKFNILLKDDKQYPFIKITWNEPFPRIFVTRELKKDGAKYIGPFTDTKALRNTTRMLEWIFPYRTCKRNIPEGDPIYERACINYQMGKCPAPCIGKISKQDYRKSIKRIIDFLNGKNQEIIDEIKDEMLKQSKDMKFELAAKSRDMIQNIQKVSNSRRYFFDDRKNRDVVAIYKEEGNAAVSVLKILSGKLLNKEIYALNNVANSDLPELMEAFLQQYYALKLDNLPHQILVEVKPSNLDEIDTSLVKKIHVPERGELKALMVMARENAFNYVEEQKLRHLRKNSRTIFPVTELKDKVGLKKLPRKMICVDISTIQGTDTVSSLVYFENGKPKKKNYRHYIMKTVTGQDDFASMAETLTRFLEKVKTGDEEKPDLVVIDGGKGQLSSAYAILKEMKLDDIEMISLAKRMEEVFLPGQSGSIFLPRSSSALRLLVNIRDEAHRFAVTFHRKRRSSRTLISDLDRISGVGEKLKFQLLNVFGSVENLKKATLEELTTVKGVGKKMAEKLLKELKGEE